MDDLARKLSLSDPIRGTGLLQGLLANFEDSDSSDVGIPVDLTHYLMLGASMEVPYYNRGFLELEEGETVIDAALEGGTAVHFAVFYNRKASLKALIEAGANLQATTAAGKTAMDLIASSSSGSCEDREAMKEMMTEALKPNGRKNLAELTKEGKFFVILHKMRAHTMTDADLSSEHDYDTVADVLLDIMFGKHKIDPVVLKDADQAASRVLLEMNYRYRATCDIRRSTSCFGIKFGTAVDVTDTLQELALKQDMIFEILAAGGSAGASCESRN